MTQTEWENEMCIKILELIQNELYVDFRYLDVAVSALTLTPTDSSGIPLQPAFLKSRCTAQRISLYFSASVDSWKPRSRFVEPFLRHCCRVDY